MKVEVHINHPPHRIDILRRIHPNKTKTDKMGIKDFTKVFEPREIFELGKLEKYPKILKKLKNSRVVIDAMPEIYRAALGMEKIKGLTDANGCPTNHITTILYGTILKLQKYKIKQYWVFDFDGKADHIKGKTRELNKRKAAKDKGDSKVELEQQEREKIISAIQKVNDRMTADPQNKDALLSKLSVLELSLEAIDANLEKLDKSAFRMQKFYIEDLKKILGFLNIPYVICPKGYDAEYICARATHDDRIFGKKIHFVFTIDADALVFGAKRLLKRKLGKNQIYEYKLDELLKEYDLSMPDFIKVALILGSDFAEKTKKIGPKTVLKKYKDVVLNGEQQEAYEIFTQEMSNKTVAEIRRFNFAANVAANQLEAVASQPPFSNMNILYDWLVEEKNFNPERVKKIFGNNGLKIKTTAAPQESK